MNDRSLRAYDDSPAGHAHLNGHLIQKVIAPDGVLLLTPTGSAAARRISDTASKSTSKSFQFLVATFSLP